MRARPRARPQPKLACTQVPGFGKIGACIDLGGESEHQGENTIHLIQREAA